MKALVKVLFVLTILFSFSAQAGWDWPTTTKELLTKEKITFQLFESAQIVLNLKEKTYKNYRRGRRQTDCKEQSLSEIVAISDYEVEFRTLREDPCPAKVITFNLREKNITSLVYIGDRTNVIESYKTDSANFD